MSARTFTVIVMASCSITISAPAIAQQKSVRACAADWRAIKNANQAAGKEEKAYVAECRAAAGITPRASAPSSAPAPTVAAPSRRIPSKTAPTVLSTPNGADQFSTEAEAKEHCPADTVVWADTNSEIYHFSDNRNYGNTQSGTYMCEMDTAAAGIGAAKNEKYP